MTKSQDNFNHLWNAMLSNHTGMVNDVNRAREAVNAFRRHAFRFTSAFIAAQENHHNEMLDMVTASGGSLVDWIDAHFEPVERMGHDRRDLIADVKAGMTEKQFVKQFTLWGVRRRSARVEVGPPADAVSKPQLDELSPEEQNAELKIEVKALREALLRSQRDAARLVREFDSMRRDLDRAERILAKHQTKAKGAA